MQELRSRGYAVAAAGDTVEVAGRHLRRPDGLRRHQGGDVQGRLRRHRALDHHRRRRTSTFDGINIDATNAQVLGVEFGGANATYKNASIGNIVDEKGMLATASCIGCTIDNVNFHDVLLSTDGIHNECLYSQAANITIKNSRFTNCATMDVFFTRGTWWGQPEYGGWTLTNNFFGAPRFENGRCCHYYAVYWALAGHYDRAVVRGNTYEADVTVDGSFHEQRRVVQHAGVQSAGHDEGDVRRATPTPTPTPTPTATPTPDADAHGDSRPRRRTPRRRRCRRGWRGTSTTQTLDRRCAGTRRRDNRGVTGYRIYRNGVAVGTTTNLNYTVSGPGVRHELHDRPDGVRRRRQRVQPRPGDGHDEHVGVQPDARRRRRRRPRLPDTPGGRRLRRAWRGRRRRKTSLGLRWNASTDNRGVVGYRLYRNGVAVATTTNLTYDVSGSGVRDELHDRR